MISFSISAIDIIPSITGSWFDQNNTGQGFNVEVLDNNRIIIFWYSYDQGSPIWLLGDGTYTGDTATVPFTQFQGSNFGVNHDADLVTSQPIGEAIFTFDTCNSGSMTYNSPTFGSGSINLNRLTNIAGLPCTDAGTPVSSTPAAFSTNIVETNGIRIEPGICELLGSVLTCNLTVTSVNTDLELRLRSGRSGTRINNNGDVFEPQEVKLGNDISTSTFFGAAESLTQGIPINGFVKFEDVPNSTQSIEFLNLFFEIDGESFEVEYFNLIITNLN
jgi:hypothetical protein